MFWSMIVSLSMIAQRRVAENNRRGPAGWQADRRDPGTGAPVENKDKFPNGMKDVADKIHAMGLKVCRLTGQSSVRCRVLTNLVRYI